MTYQKIEEKVSKDLNVPPRTARRYTDAFRKKFSGYKESIDDVHVSYTADGKLCFEVIIKNRGKNKYIIGNEKIQTRKKSIE